MPTNESEKSTDQVPWWRGSRWPLYVLVVVAGPLIILYWNRFHLTASVAILALGYLAAVASIYTLFRTGTAAVREGEEDDAGWGRPVGARAELEREKKALLKAIKEAEFDLAMGKLSKADAEAMIAMYRAQAIAVIRELERKADGDASAREQIEREVRARLEVAKAKKAAEDRRPQGKKGRKQATAASQKAEEKAEPIIERPAKADEEKAEAAKAEDDAAEKAAEAAGEAAGPEAAADAAADAVNAEDASTEKAAESAEQTDPPEAAAAVADPSNAEPRGAAAAAGVAKEATS